MDHAVNWHSFFFLLFALLTCGFTVAVVVTGNIVRMAYYLTIALGSAAGLFFLAGADFVGAMQLMIYVGGTLVLLIFGVMLTAQGPFVALKPRGGDWVIAALAGGGLLSLLLVASLSVQAWRAGQEPPDHAPPTATRIGLALLGARADRLDLPADQAHLSAGMSGYLLPFEIISVHLLVVLVGAAYLARAKKRVAAAASPAAREARR